MSLDFNAFDVEWAKKGVAKALYAYGLDCYISIPKKNKGNICAYISFRNDKLAKDIEYLQIARFGDLLLFKKSDKKNGWKLCNFNSLTPTKALQPTINILPKDIAELIRKHNHEGFDLNYDVKSGIYYIDTTKAVEG